MGGSVGYQKRIRIIADAHDIHAGGKIDVLLDGNLIDTLTPLGGVVDKTYSFDLTAFTHELKLSLWGAGAEGYIYEVWVLDVDENKQLCHDYLTIYSDVTCRFVVPANTAFMYMTWPPSTIYAGQRFNVNGYLYFDWDGDGVYETPLPGKAVILVYDGKQIGSEITDSNGWFSIDGYIYETGNFTLKVKFMGEGV